MRIALLASLFVGAAVLAGCSGLPVARVALPTELRAHAAEPIEGIGAGRRGRFMVGGASGTFDRGLDRIDWFEALQRSTVALRYAITWPDGARVDARCQGGQADLSRRVIEVTARPFSYACEWPGIPEMRMELRARSSPGVGRAVREGRLGLGGRVLEVRSLHEAEGSALPLVAPIGYLFLEAGRPVGAVELNGEVPRLWRPGPGDPLHAPVTLAALALALLWDPAASGP
jgi:hypothetical protein